MRMLLALLAVLIAGCGGGGGEAVYQQTVITRQMPQNNATGITEAERDLIRRWYQAGGQIAPR